MQNTTYINNLEGDSTMSKQFGVNIWWTVPTFRMDGEKAQEALTRHGFETEDMPLPGRRKAVSRAAFSFQDRRHKDGRRVTEKAKDNGQCVVYGLLGRSRKGDEEVSYDQGTTIRLDKDSGRVEAEGALANEFHDRLAEYTDAITDDDVRHFLRKIIRLCKGIAKRPSGGIYFVPEKFVGIIESAQYVIDDLNVGAKLYLEGVVNGKRERGIVWEAVESDIEKRIDDTLKAVERIEKRASSVQSHEAKLSEMTELMDIYRELLGEEAKYEELAERLEDATSEVASKMAALQDEDARRPAPQVSSGHRRSKIKADVVTPTKSILKKDGAMHYSKIAEALESQGIELRATKTKTKAQWLLIQINKAIREGDKELKAEGRGVFAA